MITMRLENLIYGQTNKPLNVRKTITINYNPMKIRCFLIMLIFSFSCYSQESLKIDVSISRAKKGLVVKFKNDSDTIFMLKNGDKYSTPLDQISKSNHVIINSKKDKSYKDCDLYYPLLPETGEIWFKKEHKTSSFIEPKQEVTMDILGIKEELLAENKLYVKLFLPFLIGIKGSDKLINKLLIIEKWVPVE